jgi:hypothetical protein
MSAVVELGFSAPAVFTGIDRVEKRLNGLDRNVQQFGKRGGMGGGLGNVSMQLQDIAVQMQSGTRASIIFAQQGSQMLSAFGPAGAVAGAIAAIGGALYMGAEASKESFASMMADMEAYRGSLARTLSTIDVDNVSGSIDTLTKRIADAQAEQAKLYTVSGSLFALISETFLGDKSAEEKTRALAAMQAELGDAYGRMAEQALAASGRQVQVANLRAQGDEAAASALEKEIALALRRAAIDAMPLPQYAKDQLATDAAALNAAEEKRTLLEAQKQLEQQRQQLAFEQLDTADQINSVQQRLNDLLIEEDDLRAKGQLDALAVVGIEQRRLALQGQLNQLRSKFNDEAERAAQTAKREADEAARANQQRKQAVMSAMDEYNLLKAKSTARKNDDYQVDREIAIRNRRDQLMKENGLGMAEATRIATEMRDMEERAANNGRAPKSRGPKPGQGRKMGGLDQFLEGQGQAWGVNALPESAFDKRQRTPFSWEANLVPGSRAPGIAERNARNATEPTPAKPISLDDALVKILTLLPKNIASALMDN